MVALGEEGVGFILHLPQTAMPDGGALVVPPKRHLAQSHIPGPVPPHASYDFPFWLTVVRYHNTSDRNISCGRPRLPDCYRLPCSAFRVTPNLKSRKQCQSPDKIRFICWNPTLTDLEIRSGCTFEHPPK